MFVFLNLILRVRYFYLMERHNEIICDLRMLKVIREKELLVN